MIWLGDMAAMMMNVERDNPWFRDHDAEAEEREGERLKHENVEEYRRTHDSVTVLAEQNIEDIKNNLDDPEYRQNFGSALVRLALNTKNPKHRDAMLAAALVFLRSAP